MYDRREKQMGHEDARYLCFVARVREEGGGSGTKTGRRKMLET